MTDKIRIIEYDGDIVLYVPTHMGGKQIEKFVDENKDKIREARKRLKAEQLKDKKVK